MIAAVSSCWALLLGLALLMIGNGLQGSLLGLRATLEAFPTAITGILMSAYYIGALAGSVLVPRMVNRVGHVRVFAALASLASTTILIHAAVIEPATWAAMRLLAGFCFAGLYVVTESWLNDVATNETRGRLLSVYMIVWLGGMTVGQGLLNLADPRGDALFMLVSVLVSLGLIPMMLSATPGPELRAPTPIGLRALYQISPTGMLAFCATGVTQGALTGMGAVYGAAIGLSVAEISLFMALVLIGGMVLQWPIGWLSDRLDRRGVLVATTLLAAAFALAASLAAGRSVGALLAAAFLYGGSMMPMYSLCLAYANDHLRPEQRVSASGTLLLVGGVGAAAGPLLVAAAMDLLGPPGFFWCLATLHLAIGAFVIYRMTRRAGPPRTALRGHLVLPPRATPVASVMYAEASGAAPPTARAAGAAAADGTERAGG
jgi:MFS family permease